MCQPSRSRGQAPALALAGQGAMAAPQELGRNERLGIYTANFGNQGGGYNEAVAKALDTLPAQVIVLQEAQPAVIEALEAKWCVSYTQDDSLPLMVAAKKSTVASIEQLDNHYTKKLPINFPEPATALQSKFSRQLFVKLNFSKPIAGADSLVICNIHIHSQFAHKTEKSPQMKAYVAQLADALRASGARVMCGDANMALFSVTDMLRDRLRETGGIDLVAHHRELTATNGP